MGGSGSEAGSRGSVETAKAGLAMKAAVAREATVQGHGSGVGYLAGLEVWVAAGVRLAAEWCGNGKGRVGDEGSSSKGA